MGDIGELAKIIWNTSRADESTISAIGANHVARAILASDWLAQREADLAADEREQIAQALEAQVRTFGQTDPGDAIRAGFIEGYRDAARIARNGGTA